MKKLSLSLLLLAFSFYGCKKKVEDLGAPEAPVINYTRLDANTFVFTNGTPNGGYVTKWDFGGLKTSTKYNDTMFFAIKGTYVVTLTSNSRGGVATTSTTVDVPTTSPYGATPSITQIDEWRYRVEDVTLTGTSRIWDFGNGVRSTKAIDTVYYPFSGTRTISLTSTSSKGTSTNKLTKITVAADDDNNPMCDDQVIKFLTGGCEAVNGKTWVIDPSPFKTNVGDKNDTSSSYYRFPDGLGGATWTEGALNNTYTFKLRDFEYVPANTNATLHFAYANKYFGMNQAQYADIQYKDPAHKKAPYIIRKDITIPGTTGYSIEILDNSYIGYFEKRHKYYIVWITENSMYLAHTYSDDPETNPADDGNARYFTFRAR